MAKRVLPSGIVTGDDGIGPSKDVIESGVDGRCFAVEGVHCELNGRRQLLVAYRSAAIRTVIRLDLRSCRVTVDEGANSRRDILARGKVEEDLVKLSLKGRNGAFSRGRHKPLNLGLRERGVIESVYQVS